MKKQNLIYLLSAILIIGFLATSLISYFVSKSSIRSSVVNYELPLIAAEINLEVQQDLLKPLMVSRMMAQNRFLRDWVTAGERDEQRIIAYLRDVQANNRNAKVSYFISAATNKYYYGDGNTRVIDEKDPRDAWYPRFRDGKQEYVLNLDTDLLTPDLYLLYVDYRVVDDKGKFIGIAGNGIALDDLKNVIKNYQTRYKRTIYFVDTKGQIRLSDGNVKPIGQSIQSFTGAGMFESILTQQKQPGEQVDIHQEYSYLGNTYLLNLKYIPELKWFLVVEKDEANTPELKENKKTLYINLALCSLVTAIAILLTQASIRRYQGQIERLATTDSLTGISNRSAFDLVINRFLSDSKRHQQAVSLILFDLDDFKKINDTYGHAAGDLVLKEVACELTSHIRQADFFCRWGGEEFLVLLKNCDTENAERLAENFRKAIERMAVKYQSHYIKFTASFGMATQQGDETIEQLILRADRHLYAAKNTGRNRVMAGD